MTFHAVFYGATLFIVLKNIFRGISFWCIFTFNLSLHGVSCMFYVTAKKPMTAQNDISDAKCIKILKPFIILLCSQLALSLHTDKQRYGGRCYCNDMCVPAVA